MFKLPLFSIQFGTKSSNADTAVIGVYQESNKKATAPKGPYSQYVTQLNQLESKVFTAQLGSVQFIRFIESKDTFAPQALLIGLGNAK